MRAPSLDTSFAADVEAELREPATKESTRDLLADDGLLGALGSGAQGLRAKLNTLRAQGTAGYVSALAALQPALGNAAVLALHESVQQGMSVQRSQEPSGKARPSSPDELERAVADARSSLCEAPVVAQPKVAPKRAGPSNRAAPAPAPGRPLSKPPGNGEPLAPDVLAEMERLFGADFSDVRVQEGPFAEEAQAEALTLGRQLVFAPGRYDPESRAGRELLAHELQHVVQQRQGRVKATGDRDGLATNEDRSLEEEADRAAKRAGVSPDDATEASVGGGRPAGADRPPASSVAQLKKTPREGLADDMVSVADTDLEQSGTVTCGKAKGGRTGFRVSGPKVDAMPKFDLTSGVYIESPDIKVGVIQTLNSSERVARYSWGGVPLDQGGKVVGEVVKKNKGGRDRTGVESSPGVVDWPPAPWYTEPGTLSETKRQSHVYFKDIPSWKVDPTLQGKGKLIGTRGADDFTGSFAAKREGTTLHRDTFAWDVDWGMTIDPETLEGKGKTAAIRNESKDIPTALDGKIEKGDRALHFTGVQSWGRLGP